VAGSGVPIPGVMEETDFGKWMELDEEQKRETMILLGEWLKEIYDDEFNFLIRKALEQKKDHGPSERLLVHLNLEKRNRNYQIRNVSDIVTLQSEFQDLNGFLDCSHPAVDQVTRKGRFFLHKTNNELLLCELWQIKRNMIIMRFPCEVK
jgi:hypothetical protein